MKTRRGFLTCKTLSRFHQLRSFIYLFLFHWWKKNYIFHVSANEKRYLEMYLYRLRYNILSWLTTGIERMGSKIALILICILAVIGMTTTMLYEQLKPFYFRNKIDDDNDNNKFFFAVVYIRLFKLMVYILSNNTN